MIEIACVPNPLFGSCAYVVVASSNGDAVVIDPGDTDLTLLRSAINRAGGQRVAYVVLTHEHFDHIAGADRVREECGAKLVCSAPCAQAVADPKLNMSFYRGTPFKLGPPDWVCEELGWTLPWSGGAITLMPTPGHSPGGVCSVIEGALFSGDTLLGNRKTPTHLPGGDRAALERSVGLVLGQFPAETRVYPGHGEDFSLGDVDPRVVLGERTA